MTAVAPSRRAPHARAGTAVRAPRPPRTPERAPASSRAAPPRRAPAPRDATARRPATAVASARRRARSLAWVASALTVLALMTAVAFHVLLAQGQMRLDALHKEVARAEQEYVKRRLETAQLSSPTRIAQEAARLGLVPPSDPVTYLPVPGASQSSVGADAATSTSAADWKKVKPHLGTPP